MPLICHFDFFIGTSTLQKSASIHRFFNYQIYTYIDKSSNTATFHTKIIETQLNCILQKRFQKWSMIETNYRYNFDIFLGIIEPVHKVMLGKL